MSEKRKKAGDDFYGTVTVGERGQIVIPAEARRAFDIETGEKLIVIGTPDKHHLMICKAEALHEFLEMMVDHLRRAESALAEDTELDSDNCENGGTRS
ncbi:MAG: AbrB/MazE/SpoVT family DNA-binding domain-containing protein [Capsulimonadaceae bacterium]|nr:AbrB/MazE/SpoVT family DNA-binding domain-containing protein [Capsulimonadaceae bacterium]